MDDEYKYGLYSLYNGPALPSCFIINNTHRCMPIYTDISNLDSFGMMFRNQNGYVLGALKGMNKVRVYEGYAGNNNNNNIQYSGNQYDASFVTKNPNEYISFSTKYTAGSVRIYRDTNITIKGSNAT